MAVRNFSTPARRFNLEDVKIPDVSIQVGGRFEVIHKTVKNAVIVHWPDGAPCILVNQYLLEKGDTWSGETARATATDLSHLIRYCFSYTKTFRELADGDVSRFVSLLASEKASGRREAKRNNNTIRKIVHQSLCFLEWYQRSLCQGGRLIVGAADRDAAITVVEKWNRHSKRMEWDHRYLPEPVSTDPKLPISWTTICNIDEAIERKGLVEVMSDRLMRSHRFDKKFVGTLFDYLYARRSFMTWLLRRTGLRPGEMMLLNACSMERALQHQVLEIPTLKRRRKEPPLRLFFFTPHDTQFIRRYLMVRKVWLSSCQKRLGSESLGIGSLFLSTSPGRIGRPISKSGLEKDFSALCVEAGLAGQQVCFSMYRHRFITEQVRRLMKEFGLGAGAVISDPDYRALLERVRAMTGHSNIDSLWHYIDLARKDDDIWSAVELSERLQSASDFHRSKVNDIARELRNGTRTPSELADELQELALAIGDFC